MKILRALVALALTTALTPVANAQARPREGGQVQRVSPGESDQTLRAMRDEMERSRERLVIPGGERPYFIEYRLVDIDVKTVVASFGALVSSATARNRLMEVDVRVGDYRLDSSNFVGEDAFRGFLGTTGMVGIDRDYDSLRQDLWLGTDQAYKAALANLAGKRAYIRSLAQPPNIDDFSREQPTVLIEPRSEPNWTSRDWEQEARATSAVFRQHPQVHGSRVTYHFVTLTRYLMTSEGTQLRVSRSVAAIEAGIDTQADDGMRLHHFYAAYAPAAAGLPGVETVKGELDRIGRELAALRDSQPARDYVGPVLFEAPAAAAMLGQMLGPSVSGARSPLSMMTFFDQMMERLGGRSEWMNRLNTRVLPNGVTLVDDPTAKEFRGQPLLGTYQVDEEGIPAQRVTLVENGTLRALLMSRRPGPDLYGSNGHARLALLGDARPALSNVFFQSANSVGKEELRKKFLEMCRASGRDACLIVRQMDNPALAIARQEDFSEIFAGLAAGVAAGDRAPLLVYRMRVADGSEELVRGARVTALALRNLREIAAIGDDISVFHYFQNTAEGLAGTALGAFGNAQGGLPTSVVAPSLLFEDVEVRGARGEPRRPPLISPPPLN